MKAIVYNKNKKPHKLDCKEIPIPTALADQLLVKVHNFSINAADYRSVKMGIKPKSGIFGSAISGVVHSIGENIQKFKIGDQVLGDLTGCGFGGFAEYAVVTENALALKPKNLSFEDAVTIPVAATTALAAIQDLGNIYPGQSVLIVGAGGGVGTFSIQLAKHFECHVTAVSSERNLGQSINLGADKVLDYNQTNFLKENTNKYDLILAVNGNYSLVGFRRKLKPNGKFVMIGGTLSQIFRSLFFGWILSFGRKKMKNLSAKVSVEDMAFLAQLMADNKIKSVIEKAYSIDQFIQAWDYISKGHVRGKLIFHMNPS